MAPQRDPRGAVRKEIEGVQRDKIRHDMEAWKVDREKKFFKEIVSFSVHKYDIFLFLWLARLLWATLMISLQLCNYNLKPNHHKSTTLSKHLFGKQ